jgi:hypothetical protein
MVDERRPPLGDKVEAVPVTELAVPGRLFADVAAA